MSPGATFAPLNTDIADESCDGRIAARRVLGTGFRPYERISFVRAGETRADRPQDVLRAGPAAAVLPLDLARQEIVLLRQFRLPAQLANGRGCLVEIVAGHVDAEEQPAEAAHRECVEEIGLVPSPLIRLLSYFTSPGMLDEEVTLFLGIVDSSKLSRRGGFATEHEEIYPMRVPIDLALAALTQGVIHNGPLIVALQWLALNRGRLAEVAAQG
ncbi:MAG TPA: NUDIX hydrolase [Xanthobacteraceae bacterium]